jgi:hypothetical protein
LSTFVLVHGAGHGAWCSSPTYLQPLTVGPGMEWIAEKLYISCTCPALPTLDVSKRRIAEAGWPITELACGHDAMIAAPGELADILLG